MAKLSKEQWEQAKADYEIAGMGISDIARKYNLAKSTVSERAKTLGWEQNKTEQARTEKTNAIIKIAEIEQTTERTLSPTEQAVFDITVTDEVEFKLRNDADMEAVREHAMRLLPSIERTSDVKALMETLRIQREARLGKNPDTQVNIQNNNIDPIAQLMKEISDDAQ